VTNFNGDPDRITLYGTGSGAVLASLVVMLETVNGRCMIDKACLTTIVVRMHIGGTGTIKRRKSLVHRLILNDQTFLSPHMTSIINEISSNQKEILSHLSCTTSPCLRNQTLINTKHLLELNTYSKANGHINYLRPLENPFPFFSPLQDTKTDQKNPLRMKFYQEANALLPENLNILLTVSSTVVHSPSQQKQLNHILIDNVLNYAYTKWNRKTNAYQFDKALLQYHEQILAPLLKYAKYASNNRNVHILERYSTKYQSELPLTFGYVLAPSMSVYNETYLSANENERRESLKMMDLFAKLLHNG
jgi:hypothetical protein